jgi:hypothetical protein
MTALFSIVMEYENAATHDGDEAAPIFAALFRQVAGHDRYKSRGELILVFDAATQDVDDIDRVIASASVVRDKSDCRSVWESVCIEVL